MSKWITKEDLPVTEKHPDWVEWMERNGINPAEVKLDGLNFDWSNRQLSWRNQQTGEGEWPDGTVRVKRPIIPMRKTVDSPPPWVLR